MLDLTNNDGQKLKMDRNPRGTGLLKDLFIPHAGNDYKPQVLAPRRLFFHALAASAVKVLLLTFLLSFPITAWLTPDVLLEQGRRIINLTNDIRTELNRPLLKRSDILEKAALAKAQDMIVGQYFAHSSPENKGLKNFLDIYGYGFQSAGENLALGFSSAEEVVEAWTKSPTHYANMIDDDFIEIGVGAVSGKYQGYETTLVAQFFGSPKDDPVPDKTVDKARLTLLDADRNISVDQSKTVIMATQTPDDRNLIFKVTAYLSNNVQQALVSVGDRNITLYPDFTEEGRWSGHLLLESVEKEKFLNPVVLATLQAQDQAGNVLNQDINWAGAVASEVSVLDHYTFLKQNQPDIIQPLFNVSHNYYFLMLGLTIVAILLNVFIKIRVQHASVIFSSLAFLAFMSILIIL